MEKEFQNDKIVDLAVAFHCELGEIKKIEDKTIYYLVPNHKINRVEKILDYTKQFSVNEKNIKNYIKVVEDFKPDIIHIWGTENDYGLLTKYINIPIVIHIQGVLTVYAHKWFSGNIGKFDIIKATTISGIIKRKIPLSSYYFFKRNANREKEIYKSCKFFMGRTEWDRRIVNVLSKDAHYFHCDEVLREQFYVNQWQPIDKDVKVIFTTIRGNIYKGFETILETSKILVDKIGNNFIWKIAGIEKNDTYVKLFQKVTGLNLNKLPIKLLGQIDVDQVIKEILNADLFVHPSHIDNSPNSVCEAMILGAPVIATYAGGTGSLLENGKEGILIQDGDPWSLAGAILELFENPNKSFNYSKNAKLRAKERHAKKIIVNDLMDIYEKILICF
ncbi:MAG: glycosyltransferase family 4 protein [Ignavibacteriae bacterium]|nr:glycosyltransferase family 4 protein [Ignavibacteriota bacterium]